MPVVAAYVLIEEFAANAWPAAIVQIVDGWLQIEEDNLAALRFYTGLGFQPSHQYHYRVAAP